MTVFPALERELREQSRWPMTYWMRPLAAGIALAAVILMAPQHLFQIRLGAEYFQQLHFVLFMAIWIFVPLTAADLISRERREGTLGLLFLTPLRPWEVVFAKALACGLRSLGLILAAIPLLAITMLLGGVSWQQLLLSVTILLNSLLLALSAGLLTSSFFNDRSHAVVTAAGVAGLVFACYAMLACVTLFFHAMQWQYLRYFDEDWTELLSYGWAAVAGNSRWYWSDLLAMSQRNGLPLWRPLAFLTLWAALMSGLMLFWTVTRVNLQWHERPHSRLAGWFKRFGLTPAVLANYYRRWLRQGLERNPVGWLEQRQWSDRAAVWLWYAAVVGMAVGQWCDPRFLSDSSSIEIIKFIYWVMAAGLIGVSACSFVRERAAGVMELLLVTPLREGQIILGKLRAIWRQVVPAALLMLVLWLVSQPVWPPSYAAYERLLQYTGPPLVCFPVMGLTIPVIGLYFSLRYRGYVAAISMTALMSLVLPWVIVDVAVDLMRHFSPLGTAPRWWINSYAEIILADDTMEFLLREGGLPLVWQLTVAALLWRRLHRRMIERNFSLTV